MKTLLFAAGVGSLLVSGVFFAFSTFVMAGLARIPAPSGISAMQAINITVFNPLFMGLFLGMGAASLAVLATSFRASGLELSLSNGAAIIYLLGVLGITFAFNVPMNNEMAALDPAASSSVDAWKNFVSGWTMWNHMRCVAALVAGVVFLWSR